MGDKGRLPNSLLRHAKASFGASPIEKQDKFSSFLSLFFELQPGTTGVEEERSSSLLRHESSAKA
jgi:hypothetical protein